MANGILFLSRPTKGDRRYYTRWECMGRIYNSVMDLGDKSKMENIYALVVDHRTRVTESLINQIPNLEYILTPNTAHSHIAFDPREKGIELISLKGESKFLNKIHSVSEFVFSLILRLLRPLDTQGHLLRGKTIGIVGLGRIGTHVHDIAKNGFGMKVMAWNKGSSPKSLSILFSQCDIVSVHLEENSETKKMISAKLINLMPPHAVLINTARGSVLDEAALKDALEQQKIAGAAVDVVENERVLNKQTPNLIISNHVGGSTIEDRITTDLFIIDKFRDHLGMGKKRGRPKKNVH